MNQDDWTISVTIITLVTHRRPGKEWWIPAAAFGGLAVLTLLARLDPWHVFTWLGD